METIPTPSLSESGQNNWPNGYEEAIIDKDV